MYKIHLLLVFVAHLLALKKPSLRFHKNYDPRQERATLLRLDDLSSGSSGSNKTSSYSYLISLGKGEAISSVFDDVSKPDYKQKELMSSQDRDSVIASVGSLVKTLSQEQDGFTSLKDTSANHSNKEQGNMNPEPRIPPPTHRPVSVAAFKRTSPNDIVGFSAIRASGFSRAGNSRIYFEKTAADTNYGWDSTHSMFITHFPGMYFFTFSLKADADEGDNFKYEVSLMKNGEEVVSVGGAVDPSFKNVGTSASNSVLLDLAKGDKVWLQLLRGGLVETTNRKTGYSSFSGYKLGCNGNYDDMPNDFTQAAIEDVDQTLDDGHGNTILDIDRVFNTNRRPVTKWKPEPYPSRPNIYEDKNIYDAFNYEASDERRGEQDRPLAAHRPFDNNGPPIVDRNYYSRPPSHNNQGFQDYFNGERGSVDRFATNKDRIPEDDRRYSSGERYQDKPHQPWDRERPSPDRDEDRYYLDTQRISHNRDKYSNNRDQYKDSSSNNNYFDADPSSFFQRRQIPNNDQTHLSYGK